MGALVSHNLVPRAFPFAISLEKPWQRGWVSQAKDLL